MPLRPEHPHKPSLSAYGPEAVVIAPAGAGEEERYGDVAATKDGIPKQASVVHWHSIDAPRLTCRRRCATRQAQVRGSRHGGSIGDNVLI